MESVIEQFNGLMSRPQQPLKPSELDPNSPNYEVQLAFALTGLNRSDLFSSFFPLHRLIASKLIDYFMSIESVDDLLKVASYGHNNVNPPLFYYALSVAILNRSDTQNIPILSPAEVFPDRFFIAPVIQDAITELNSIPEGARVSVDSGVGTTSDESYPETRLEYFRHDLGLNVGYYFWHLTHPSEAIKKQIVKYDRGGELWCYFHQQIVARYNSERYCNGLLPVEPLSNLYEAIPEGYFPKLTTQAESHSWSPRFEDSVLRDLNRPFEGLSITKTQFKRWIDRICNAIELGYILDKNGNRVSLNNDQGCNVLGNLLQSSSLSVNRHYYGDIANIGLAFIAYCHDPENYSLQPYGVMGEPATCMRDMLFYRWYAYVVQIIQLHKMQLPHYTKDELGFDGVKISSLDIEDDEGANKNVINTSWKNSDFNLSNGLNFQPEGNVYASVTHLQHNDFQYILNVENDTVQQKSGTIRIFIAQKCDVRDRPLTIIELRHLMIELDRFEVDLTPGNNRIVRKSSESSVTIPSENYFEPEAIRSKIISKTADMSAYCLAGWPSHLLIPKGTSQGANYILFAMVSKDDKVQENTTSDDKQLYGKCSSASSYCGIRNKKYPDKKSMGYPFDRPAPIEVLTLKQFILPNMIVQDVKIKFT